VAGAETLLHRAADNGILRPREGFQGWCK